MGSIDHSMYYLSNYVSMHANGGIFMIKQQFCTYDLQFNSAIFS